MKKYVFIDTNIYLDFYRVSKGDLNKLDILRNGFADPNIADNFILCVNMQNHDEYYRNRVNVIEATLKEFYFKKVDVPGLMSNQWPDTSKQFIQAQNQMESLLQSLKDKTRQLLYDEGLEVDRLIGSMMEKPDIVDENIVRAAERRYKILGNPPGKKDSCGDAIHWEYLLHKVPSSGELIIITADNDWYSSAGGDRPNDFLLYEWRQRKGASSNLQMYRSVQAFLKKEMKVVLEREAQKDDLLEELRNSSSFDESRRILGRLMGYKGELSGHQKTKLIQYSLENSQIYKAQEYSPKTIGDRLCMLINLGGSPGELDEKTMTDFRAAFSSDEEK